MFEVDIGQAGIAAEQKEVADDFEPFHGEYLVREAVQFFVGQVASVHLLEMEFVARQRIVFRPAVQIADMQHGLQLPHQLHRRIIRQSVVHAQPPVEIGSEAGMQLLDRHIGQAVARLHELRKSVAGQLVTQIRFAAALLGFEQVGIILDETVANLQ